MSGLDPNSESMMALKANMDGESFGQGDLIRVKTPGSGGTIWTIEGPAGAEAVKAIEGICVFKAKKGVIWASQDDDASMEDPPVVVSNDLKIGRLNFDMKEGIPDYVPEEMMETLIAHELSEADMVARGLRYQPGCYDWEKLPYCQWGTGKGGRGKYAKEHLLLFMLRPQLGEVLPLFIQAGVASVSALKKFFLHVNCPYNWAFISLGLEKHDDPKPHSRIVPQLLGKVPPQYRKTIQTMYTDKLKESHEAGLIDATSASGE